MKHSINLEDGDTYQINVPIECPKCKVEFWSLTWAGGQGLCERCHFETLYQLVKNNAKKIKERKIRWHQNVRP